MNEAFEILKFKLAKSSVLAYLDYGKAFIVYADTSNKAIGAVLSQTDEYGREHPIHFSTKIFSQAETKYFAFKRQAVRVIFKLKKFRHYILWRRFKL